MEDISDISPEDRTVLETELEDLKKVLHSAQITVRDCLMYL